MFQAFLLNWRVLRAGFLLCGFPSFLSSVLYMAACIIPQTAGKINIICIFWKAQKLP
jgi:hypothetical protein